MFLTVVVLPTIYQAQTRFEVNLLLVVPAALCLPWTMYRSHSLFGAASTVRPSPPALGGRGGLPAVGELLLAPHPAEVALGYGPRDRIASKAAPSPSESRKGDIRKNCQAGANAIGFGASDYRCQKLKPGTS
jgi:hypothetical protein